MIGRYLPNRTSRVVARAAGDDVMKDLEKVLEIILLRAECSALSSNVKMFSVLFMRISCFLLYKYPWHRLASICPRSIHLLVNSKTIKVKLRFRKSTLIYLFHSIFKSVDAEKVWSKKNRGSQLHVLVINCAVLLICPFQPVYPDGAEPTRPVSGGNFGKRRKKDWIYKVFVKEDTKNPERR